MKNSHFPGLFQAADTTSQKSQRLFKIFFWINLFCLSGASLSASLETEPKFYQLQSFATGILFFFALVISVVINYTNAEQNWYDGRTIAETIKSLTWKFMTQSEPFNTSLDIDIKNFTEQVYKTIKDNKKMISNMSPDTIAIDIVSKEQLDVRSKTTQERKEYYIINRLNSQINWYSLNSLRNKKKSVRYFYITLFLQLASTILCFTGAFTGTSPWFLIGFFTTLSASIVGWSQMSQNKMLCAAYSQACCDLTEIKQSVGNNVTKTELSEFVNNAESAISREHTLWIARRDSL